MPQILSPILLAGSLTRDRVMFAGKVRETAGGVVWYAGRVLVELGVATRIVTRSTVHDRGWLLPLSQAGAEVVWAPSDRTTVLRLDYGPGHAAQRSLELERLAEPIGAELLASALDGIGLVYLGPVHPADLGDDCLGVLRKRPGLRVALDVQGLARMRRGRRLLSAPADSLGDWLAVATIVKASEGEARMLCGCNEAAPAELLERLVDRLPGRELLLTCGEQGAWAAGNGIPCHACGPAVAADPTGAGDVIFAAYLARRSRGAAPAAALEFAVPYVTNWLRTRRRA